MNISPITYSTPIHTRQIQTNKKYSQHPANVTSYNEVSFKQAMKTPISDFVKRAASDDMERLQRIATTFLDVIESVATRLTEKGVSFDRKYCEEHVVKSPESYTSKIMRSGSMIVPDRIRATLYSKNIYDLSLLNDEILPEFRKRGYILASADISSEELLKRGYIPDTPMPIAGTVKVPDIDIRLRGAETQADKLDPQWRFAISKPQSSGYEDIQMRFVRDYDRKKNPVMLELIILMGKNYANAKHIDYEKIYKFTRLFNELNINKNSYEDANISIVKRYIDLIKSMFKTEASIKLFDNAKNKDIYGIEEESQIRFSPSSVKLFENYFIELKRAIGKFYKERITNCKNEERAKKLKKERRADTALISNIEEGLKQAIEFFNKQKAQKQTNLT